MKITCTFFYFFLITSATAQIALPFKKGQKWGFINHKHKWLIQPAYDRVEIVNGFYKILTLLDPKKYTNLFKKGIVSVEGELILDTVYLTLDGGLKDGFFIGSKIQSQGVISQELLSLKGVKTKEWDDDNATYLVKGGLLAYYVEDGVELRDTSFELVTTQTYTEVNETSFKNIFSVQKNDNYGLFNTLLKKEIVPPIYFAIIEFPHEDRFVAMDENKVSFLIDLNGRVLFQSPGFLYQYLGEDIWSVRSETTQLFQLRKTNGDTLNKNLYTDVWRNNHGLILAQREQKGYTIDWRGREVALKYPISSIYEFHKDYYILKENIPNKGFRYGVINKKGKWMLPPEYKEISTYKIRNTILFYVTTEENKKGYVTSTGKELWSD